MIINNIISKLDRKISALAYKHGIYEAKVYRNGIENDRRAIQARLDIDGYVWSLSPGTYKLGRGVIWLDHSHYRLFGEENYGVEDTEGTDEETDGGDDDT